MDTHFTFPTSIEDIDREILISCDIESIVNVQYVNKYIHRLCDNNLWRSKFNRKYVDLGNNIDYKDLYCKIEKMNMSEIFLFAVTEQYYALVQYAIDNGVDVNTRYTNENPTNAEELSDIIYNANNPDNKHGITALMIPCAKGHVEMVKLLLNNGVDVHARREYAMNVAIKNGYIDIVRLLIDNGANIHIDNDRVLVIAASKGHLNMVKLFIELEAVASKDKAFIESAGCGHIDIIKYLITSGVNIHADNDKAFIASCRNGKLDCIQLLLEHKISNITLDNALIAASEGGHEHAINLLLEHGVDIHAHDDMAFVRAVRREHYNITQTLLNHGANAYAKNMSAIVLSIATKNIRMIKLLLDNDIHFTIWCVVMGAGLSGNTELLKLLRGAYPEEFEDIEEQIPFMLANINSIGSIQDIFNAINNQTIVTNIVELIEKSENNRTNNQI